MEAIYYTLSGVLLYLAADWVLQRIEVGMGRRLEHRTLVFFGILLTMALVTFAVLRRVIG